ncbi:alpha/beta hydrolase [Enterococcus songbeiensis]|uniref:alpha/beta hydrolase n=1 Tax=Enterococcus songbeiensis TaxID=2559927 RepID=UPI0010F45796|nr:alpha/beta hydrolase family protein [Enterococcus songbeiensis]
MAFLQVSIYSNVLEMEVGLNVILPQRTEKMIGTSTEGSLEDLPVLYLLHGMGGNQSVWGRRTSIERYVENLGLAVIMPSTDLAWYTNTQYGMDYWTFIADELPAICHELFPQLTWKRAKTFAAGLSMGGYGAVKLGLKRPHQFAAIASLSGAVALAEEPESLLSTRNKAYWEGVFGPLDQLKGSENDPIQMLVECPAEEAPKFFLACGTEDFLYTSNQYFVKQARGKGLDVTYEEGPGEHNWIFWDQWIQRVLTWLPLEN